MLLTDTCAGCGGPGPAPCPRCQRQLRRARAVAVDRRSLDTCRALLVYEGPARNLVARVKYRNDRRVLAWLADTMSRLLTPPPDAVVTWVPTTRARRHRRGFDQAELLARALARRWNLPCRDLLVRRPGVPQTGRTLTERQQGVPFTARRGQPIDTPVVLIDDVVTTGATLRSAAAALRAAGAPWIGGMAAAATPRRH